MIEAVTQVFGIDADVGVVTLELVVGAHSVRYSTQRPKHTNIEVVLQETVLSKWIVPHRETQSLVTHGS